MSSIRTGDVATRVATLTETREALEQLSVQFDGNIKGTKAELNIWVKNVSTDSWELVYGPVRPGAVDLGVSWTTPTPAAYLTEAGDSAVRIAATRPGAVPHLRADWLQITVE